MTGNLLCYGDNLDIIRQYIKDESVDLVYLDPPFNSNQSYNVLFAERGGARSASQIHAFEDTWHWDHVAIDAFKEVGQAGGKVSKAMQAFEGLLEGSDMMAYLAMMAPRLKELHRVLKPTGSIYLHCDPTASHYLKLLLDAIFDPRNFRNEIIWRRTRAHNDKTLARFGAIHDTILYYTKGSTRTFHKIYTPRAEHAPKTHDIYRHPDGTLYRSGDCLAPGGRGPRYEWNGHVANWRFTEEVARQLEVDGKIIYTKTGIPRVLRLLEPDRGTQLQDVWSDIDPPNSGSGELLGYPTQKPLALLERIIQVSSNPGDTILDPFCGCGTAVASAQRLNRRWIGIDITYLAEAWS